MDKIEEQEFYQFKPQEDVSPILTAKLLSEMFVKMKVIFPKAIVDQLPEEDQKQFAKIEVAEKRIVTPTKKIIL